MKKKQELTRGDILNLLKELGDELDNNEIQAQISIFGGAVMCLEYRLRYSTLDVDCIFGDERVRHFAKELARRHNIETNWLNDGVLEIVTEDMSKNTIGRAAKFGGLIISIPTARQMLAMKLFSARDARTHDLEDARKLALELGIRTFTELREVLLEYFKLESVRKRNKEHKNVIGRFMRKLEKELRDA